MRPYTHGLIAGAWWLVVAEVLLIVGLDLWALRRLK